MEDRHFQDAGSVRKGDYVMIKDQPCRVMQISAPSKIWKGPYSGCFQSQITARDIFTGKKLEATFPVKEKVNMPAVKRHECTVLDVGAAGELDLIFEDAIKSDVNLPRGTDADAELAESIRACFNSGKNVVVVVLSACGYEKVVECKAME